MEVDCVAVAADSLLAATAKSFSSTPDDPGRPGALSDKQIAERWWEDVKPSTTDLSSIVQQYHNSLAEGDCRVLGLSSSLLTNWVHPDVEMRKRWTSYSVPRKAAIPSFPHTNHREPTPDNPEPRNASTALQRKYFIDEDDDVVPVAYRPCYQALRGSNGETVAQNGRASKEESSSSSSSDSDSDESEIDEEELERLKRLIERTQRKIDQRKRFAVQ